MWAPYSLDLRERVVAAVEVGHILRDRTAVHFGVAISTAINGAKSSRRTDPTAEPTPPWPERWPTAFANECGRWFASGGYDANE